MPSYSKGARGLSVQPRVLGICTETAISLSPCLRQRGSRYAIRAGRNLPDKEFRYLRTVIVTAAVYWGFGSKLRLRQQVPLTFQHRAGVRPYTSSYDLAESCVFSKQSLPPLLCNPLRLKKQVFSPDEGTPSPEVTVSFCRVPQTGFSHAPEDSLLAYLCRFAVRSPSQLARGFSWQPGINQFTGLLPPHHLSALKRLRIFQEPPPTGLYRDFHHPDGLPFYVPPSLKR
eukprot:TRINITY_DN2918_c0_g1_i2.p2 TRINITY_DN2918_c0_g1~~TRINITY_DN2918_c0_g1_i2.p2  ORF type:complete len:229 (+),score=-66.08 TRINITY_DN2918_c0_g1_i2:67-753(+)